MGGGGGGGIDFFWGGGSWMGALFVNVYLSGSGSSTGWISCFLAETGGGGGLFRFFFTGATDFYGWFLAVF